MRKARIFPFVFVVFAALFLLGIFILGKRIFRQKSPFSTCVILEEEFCKKGKKVFLEGKFAGLGFNLPKETKIFAPYDGYFAAGNYYFPRLPKEGEKFEKYPGISFHKTPTAGETVGMAFSKISWKIDLERPGKAVKKGELIGRVSQEKIIPLKDYNFFLILADKKAKTIPILPNNYWRFFQ